MTIVFDWNAKKKTVRFEYRKMKWRRAEREKKKLYLFSETKTIQNNINKGKNVIIYFFFFFNIYRANMKRKSFQKSDTFI